MATIFSSNRDISQGFVNIIGELKALELAYAELLQENKRLRSSTNRPKLTPNEVFRLRTFWETNQYSQRELADMFDINPATVSRIVRGEYHRG